MASSKFAERSDAKDVCEDLFSQIDRLSGHFIDRLRQAVAIQSVSGSESHHPELRKMASFLFDELTALGATAELRDLESGTGDSDSNLPPVVIARHGHDSAKKTILLYGHYDVMPAHANDGWRSDPFTLVIDDRRCMVGRGSSDDKGPVLGWINALEAYKRAGIEMPVNLIFCFEGMEEQGSPGLATFLEKEAALLFKDVDAVCISDNYWLGTTKPCLTYGVRGQVKFDIQLSGSDRVLHSGNFGGAVHDPMLDLVKLLASLTDAKGKILVPGIYEQVAPLTETELSWYSSVEFTKSELEQNLGKDVAIYDDIGSTLRAIWRYPVLSISNIGGAQPGVIALKVYGSVSIRTVPDMDPAVVQDLVIKHLQSVFAELQSRNVLRISSTCTSDWWIADPHDWNFAAASKAIEMVYGVTPDLTRGGGGLPIVKTLEKIGGRVLLLPMGRGDDRAHSVNEKLDVANFLLGTKVFAAYLHYVSQT